ncbi:hypothetical protein [Staphylococcus felis]|uniref:hypothetical protein n=1 Tax=Staphylococcus felis TaxID=46127 RepID=UPI000E28BF3A|nr:hypothetical protein [Staphylococcus felis]REI14584.1 hypothetical protein DOS73_05950 [Staphylococcus felis]
MKDEKEKEGIMKRGWGRGEEKKRQVDKIEREEDTRNKEEDTREMEEKVEYAKEGGRRKV